MSKKHIEAFIKSQYQTLGARDNKERMKFVVAGIKDGHFYNHMGTDFGEFDAEAPDAVFIQEADVKLSRIVGSKILKVTKAMDDYFKEYYGVEEDEPEEVETEEEPTEEAEIDEDAVKQAFKKALKKGKLKKAQKIVDMLPDGKLKSKLEKKL